MVVNSERCKEAYSDLKQALKHLRLKVCNASSFDLNVVKLTCVSLNI